MIKQIKLPCGLDKSGKLIYINEAKNGLNCECFCPGCNSPLIAKNNGKKREAHFAHLNKVECEHGYQSAIHLMAKECFQEMEYLTFMKNILEPIKYKIDSVVLEKKVSDIIPDIVVTCDGKPFIVEIFVTHAVDDEKINKIRKLQISAIEINLSRFKNEMIDKEMLKKELCKPENISWYYNADKDMIEQKKSIIQQFGMKQDIQIGKVVCCPILENEQYQYNHFVTFNFCFHCPYCVYQNGQKFISCGKILPLLVHQNGRRNDIFINDNIVMFASEFNEYNINFQKNIKNAVKQAQIEIYNYQLAQQYSYSMFGSLIYNSNRSNNHKTKYYRSYHHRRRR